MLRSGGIALVARMARWGDQTARGEVEPLEGAAQDYRERRKKRSWEPERRAPEPD